MKTAMSYNAALAAVRKTLAASDAVICATCGATFASYMDGGSCTAALDVECPGFVLVDSAIIAEQRRSLWPQAEGKAP